MPISLKQNYYMFKQNMRAYWSGKSKIIISRFYKNYEYKSLSGNCGKLLLSKVEPHKKQFSKCPEDCNKPVTKPKRHLFKIKKSSSVIKKKPTNCDQMEPTKIKSSLWKHILGTKSKKSCPSCICPMTYQKQTILRKKDPRLSDPCYQLTPGDVLIYTKIISAKKLQYHEPQPRLTPLYTVSRAALCKMIIADAKKVILKILNQTSTPSHKNCTRIIFKINSIPFQEMRPSARKKKPFTCKDGISTEDVIYPTSTANDFSIITTNSHLLTK